MPHASVCGERRPAAMRHVVFNYRLYAMLGTRAYLFYFAIYFCKDLTFWAICF